jgi:hypothetical protein
MVFGARFSNCMGHFIPLPLRPSTGTVSQFFKKSDDKVCRRDGQSKILSWTVLKGRRLMASVRAKIVALLSTLRGAVHGRVSTIGLDIGSIPGARVDVAGAVVIRKRVGRARVLEYFGELPPCLIGIDACPSAHHWVRELQLLGHMVRLIPPSYVKAYLKRSKNNANDAAAICEAVTRPSMRFVPIKTTEQQTALMLHRTRHRGERYKEPKLLLTA